MTRSGIATVALAVGLICGGCASEMVVRADSQRARPEATVLASIDPISVRLRVEAVGFDSNATIGIRSAGLGQSEGPIQLTRGAGDVLRQIVADELRAAGHRLVNDDADVDVTVRIVSFEVQLAPRSLLWDIDVDIQMALDLASQHGRITTKGEYVFKAQRSGGSFLWPSIETTEGVIAESLDDLAELIAEGDSFAAALEHAANPGS